ncbi:MAG TPA: ArgR family transcriptional regulator, partial [Prolixibacteraceae bacterium]|nr:ArgR family transcriptional regulator [Prolixibacteraceae bacterium]
MEKNKQERQEMVRQLIRAGRLGSQEELLTLLRERGFSCTQATLSRDMHEMKVVKLPGGVSGYVYVLPDEVLL